MLSLNRNLNAGSDVTGPKVSVSLKEGLADQEEWTFKRQFSIGRGSNADIRIKDATVSRFHASVQFIEGKWWIRDMNSSNGIFVNDKKVSRCQVGQQTKLQLGRGGPTLQLCLDTPDPSDSETILVDLREIKKYKSHHFKIKNTMDNDIPAKSGGGAPRIKDFYRYAKTALQKLQNYQKNWRQHKPLVACVVLAGLILVGYVAIQEPRGSVQNQGKIDVAPNQSNSEGVSPSMNEKADASKNMDDTNANVASDTGEEYASNSPAEREAKKPNDPQQEMIQNYTADIYFNAAEKFSDHQRWQPALEYYQKVAGINPDHPELDTKIERMNFEISNQEAYEQGMAHIKEKSFEQGIAQLRQVAESSAYYHDAAQLIIDAEKMRVQAAEEQKQEEAEALKAAEKQKALDTINSALRYYADGDTNSSIMALNQIISNSSQAKADLKHRADTLKKEIAYVQSLYDQGNQAYIRKKIDTALSTWEKLIEADQKLLGTQDGYFTKSVGQKMADEYGAKAHKAYSDGDYPAAYQYSKLALDQKGDHPKALEIKELLKAISKQLYQTGYVIEEYNPEKAQEKWKQIFKICDSDTEYYQKALVKVNGK
jgi:pSer/pThr/pTyr-binding forkhead associated (FHA) protein